MTANILQIAAAAALFAAAGSAQAADTPTAAAKPAEAAPAPTPAKRYCIIDTTTGSRIPIKTCHTREQWLERGFDPLAPKR